MSASARYDYAGALAADAADAPSFAFVGRVLQCQLLRFQISPAPPPLSLPVMLATASMSSVADPHPPPNRWSSVERLGEK